MHDVRFLRGAPRLLAGLAGVLVSLAALAQDPKASPERDARAQAEFWQAVQRDDPDRVQIQLLRGVDTNARHPELGPAIVVAARERSWRTLKLLADIVGTRVDAPNRTPRPTATPRWSATCSTSTPTSTRSRRTGPRR